MMEPKYQKCVDCGQVFLQKSPNQIRCRSCQDIRDKESWRKSRERQKQRKKEEREKKKRTDCMVVNGHPQICTHMASCFYGNKKKEGCAYAIEEGVTRRSQGLWIVNGKCPAYRRKKRGEQMKRVKITIAQQEDRREIYRELTEI